MDAAGFLLAALGAAALSLLGRTALACLPAGEPGSHRPRDLPATWAASYVLGCAALGAAASACSAARLELSCAWIAAAAAVLALVRGLALPGALVPRHPVPAERATPLASALLVAALAAAAVPCFRAELSPRTDAWAQRSQVLLSLGALPGIDAPPSGRGACAAPPLSSAALAFVAWPAGEVGEEAARVHTAALALAALLLVERALATARRAPAWRRAVLVLLALALGPAATPEDGDLAAAACFALAASGLVAWTRRADARGLALACIGASAAALAHGGAWPLALAGLAATVAATAPAARRRALAFAGASAACVFAPWPLAAWTRGQAFVGDDALACVSSSWSLGSGAELAPWIAPLWVLAGAACGPALQRAARPSPSLAPAHPDVPRRDLAALLGWMLLAALGASACAFFADDPPALLARAWAPSLLVQAAPLAALLAARALVRGERSSPR